MIDRDGRSLKNSYKCEITAQSCESHKVRDQQNHRRLWVCEISRNWLGSFARIIICYQRDPNLWPSELLI